MQLFTQITQTYKTQENAIKMANKKIDLDKYRWVMGVTQEGRFHIIITGQENMHLVHNGFCVTG